MIPKSKQGAELALNIIIIAAIGLLVLAVILFIFGGRIATFTKGTSDCGTLGGECLETKCSALVPPRPGVPGAECPVSTGQNPQYCCSRQIQ